MMKKVTKVYMVGIADNYVYSEWYWIVGIFTTREKAEKFIKEHPIIMDKYRRARRERIPVSYYFKIAEIKLDIGPLQKIVPSLDELRKQERGDDDGYYCLSTSWGVKEYFGKNHKLKRY